MQKLKHKVDNKEHKASDEDLVRPTYQTQHTVNKSIDLSKDLESEASSQSETTAILNKSKKKNTLDWSDMGLTSLENIKFTFDLKVIDLNK